MGLRNDNYNAGAGRDNPCFSEFLQVGAATNLNSNWSAAPTYATVQPASDTVWHVERLTVCAVGAGALRADTYCTIATLTVGVQLRIRRGTSGQNHVLTDGRNIVCNSCLAAHSNGQVGVRDWGAGDKEISADILAGTSGFILNGRWGDVIWLYVADDFTGLTMHTWKASGRILQGPDLF